VKVEIPATGGEEVSKGASSSPPDAVVEDAGKTEALQDASPIGLEDDHDSPLDKSKFLSFEEWKKQNLEKAGQSPENVGQGRPQGGEGRRRPINNALDTLGEEGEIELDFSGFGGSSSRYTPDAASATTKVVDNAVAEESAHASPARHRSKDAGKTCKERFNYASFDCAATVLKTNSKCKSSSSVLVENKDSYMLNECSSDNKFIIIELCDDILVDTVVVANFEFFSSMFRTFRVSVSDRYPVKADRWKDLGTFEARNTRDIQAFLVENPLIWARYLRIEFLTHYGTEFYCPVSLVRVHGTTMMEEFRHQEDVARGEEDDVELIPDVEPVAPVSTATAIAETPVTPSPEAKQELKSEDTIVQAVTKDVSTSEGLQSATLDASSATTVASNETSISNTSSLVSPAHSETKSAGNPSSSNITTGEIPKPSEFVSYANGTFIRPAEELGPSASSATSAADTKSPSNSTSNTTIAAADSSNARVTSLNTTTTASAKDSSSSIQASSKGSEMKNSPSSVPGSSTAASKTTGSEAVREAVKAPPPPPAQPSTQDSFFKQTNKRLNMLETNSSLNIQYIEEQSRILRDAFVQTEKHQTKKTENFLKHLNDTVMAELKGFRNQYDQLWQSTVIELEESKARSQKEMMAFSSRLTMLADELVWAKRMNVVQSILLLASLGLFVFASKGKEYMDMPIMQQALKRSQSVLRFRGQGSFDSPSPPGSPDSLRASSPEYRHSLRKLGRLSSPDTDVARPVSQGIDDTEAFSPLLGTRTQPNDPLTPATPPRKLHVNPGLHFEPPTPEASIDGHSDRARSNSPTLSPEEAANAIARGAQSGPATPSGTRENQPLNWDGALSDDIDSELPPSIVSSRDLTSSLGLEHRKSPPNLVQRQPSPLRHTIFEELEGEEADEEIVLPGIENEEFRQGQTNEDGLPQFPKFSDQRRKLVDDIVNINGSTTCTTEQTPTNAKP
jgi:hypothetical protein